MAQKPDGKAAKTERVTFTRPAAERIAKVVRQVEAGDRKSAALSFGARVPPGAASVFRIATFTGVWSVDAQKVVTFQGQTNTANAMNLFASVGSTAAGNRPCAIAKDGTAWYLIAAKC